MSHSYFESYRQSCIERSIPCITLATQDTLLPLLLQRRPHNCLEIGSAVGYSLCWTAATIQSRWGYITGIERSLPNIPEIQHHIHTLQLHNVTIYNHSFLSKPIREYITLPLDWVLIDAMKSDYHQYLMSCWCHLADDAMVIIDDVIQFKNKIILLYKLLDENQVHYQLLPLDDGDGIIVIDMSLNASIRNRPLQTNTLTSI